jgi:hypothetical protein
VRREVNLSSFLLESLNSCGGELGIYFLIKQFRILFLHNEKGCHMDPPYLDMYGEVDVNMRSVIIDIGRRLHCINERLILLFSFTAI